MKPIHETSRSLAQMTGIARSPSVLSARNAVPVARRTCQDTRSHAPCCKTAVVLLVLLAASESVLAQVTYYVKADASGANNGSSWENAFTDLQQGLSAASPGSDVWVAAGTYYPSVRTTPSQPYTETFQLRNGVAVRGGFAGTEAFPSERIPIAANETILSGDIGAPNNASDDAFHVVSGGLNNQPIGPTAVLDRFTITRGRADARPGGNHSGGGVYIALGSPTLVDCHFTRNFALLNGGGLNCYALELANDPPLRLIRCRFSQNFAAHGGGLHGNGNAYVEDCVFEDNTAGFDTSALGGGLLWGGVGPSYARTLTMKRCRFIGNRCVFFNPADGALYGWGGAALVVGAEVVLTSCAFFGNQAGQRGGGLASWDSETTLRNCLFSRNGVQGGRGGGGIWTFANPPAYLDLVNCTLNGNLATPAGQGGGILNDWGQASVVNSIVWGSVDRMGNGAASQIFTGSGASTLVSSSDIEGGSFNMDPLFRDPDGVDGMLGTADDDLRPLLNSPVIDTGQNGDVPLDLVLDLDGLPRIVDADGLGGARVDPGCYEHCLDTDGDGLCDDWEENGIPYTDANGAFQRYILDADGDGVTDASPLRKDLFVEVDAMQDRAPIQAALDRVIAVFDQAPVDAPEGVPGGLPGISLHVQTHPAHLGLTLVNDGDYVNGESGFHDFQLDKDRYFGSPAERADTANWPRIKDVKGRAYRYCIFANTHFSPYSRTSAGVAEGFGCNDFMVTLGGICDESGDCPLGAAVWPNSDGLPGGTEDDQASTFMHELGHALGLRHGGVDDINFKPNYYSVMNYMWSKPDPDFNPGGVDGTWELRFSDEALPTLDERALSEAAGLGANFPGRWVPFTVSSFAGGLCNEPLYDLTCLVWASMGPAVPVDWNDDGAFSTTGTVMLNINTYHRWRFSENGPPGQQLHGYDDWANLEFDFKDTPHFAEGAPPIDIGLEFDAEMRYTMASLPAPPPVQLFGVNLIANGDAEAGPGADGYEVLAAPWWSSIGTFTVARYGSPDGFPTPDDPGPPERGVNFFAGGLGNNASSAMQIVSLAAAEAVIDGDGATYSLEGYLGGWFDEDDSAVLEVTFLGESGTPLGTAAIGPVTAADRMDQTGMLFRSHSASVPVGTRRANILLTMTTPAGPYNDGYADSLSLVLTPVAPCEPTITLQPADLARPIGEAATFSVTAAGTGRLGYRWRKDGVDLFDSARVSGSRRAILTISAVEMTDAGTYSVVAYNLCGSVLSAPAILSVHRSADFNRDGITNSQDFFDFLAAFFDSDPTADFNQDGAINSQDFFDFLACFFSGCP